MARALLKINQIGERVPCLPMHDLQLVPICVDSDSCFP